MSTNQSKQQTTTTSSTTTNTDRATTTATSSSSSSSQTRTLNSQITDSITSTTNPTTKPTTSSTQSTTNTQKSSITSSQQSFKLKKRTITGLANTDVDAEFTCPICFELINAAHVTKCGHSFCQLCIIKAVEHTHRCPKCNTPCNSAKDIFPNFTLNQIIDRYKEENNTKKCKLTQVNKSKNSILEYIESTQEELDLDDVNQLMNILSHRKDELSQTNLRINDMLILDFLKHVEQDKGDICAKLQHELQLISEDCKQVEQSLASNSSQSAKSSSQSSRHFGVSDYDSIDSSKIQTQIANKKKVINRYYDELSDFYIQYHNKDFEELNMRDGTRNSSANNSMVLDKLRETISKITNYTQLRCIGSVNYSNDAYGLSSIVSSLDFDRNYDHFAVVGVTKKIKVYDFQTILERVSDVHYPLYEFSHSAKLSCVTWNSYFKSQLACSDYEGMVTIWDAEAGSLVRCYQEHEKRCWGVDFSDVDPRVLASASDDSKVKIWSTNTDYAMLTLDAKSNVCCVEFKPDSKFHVLFGTADHCIHYYDLRNPKEAVRLFKGHRKAVSYVKFCDGNNFVSASTDSTLKKWKLNEGQCVKTYTGHVNEKNFVGLEAYEGYVATGSENNTVFLYYDELAKPLLQHRFEDTMIMEKVKREESMNDFVSALCWSNSNILLAANSQGMVKILELI